MDRQIEKRLLPIVAVHRIEDAEPLAEAVLKGGLNLIEILLRTPVAYEVIRRIKSSLPEMLVGAGTVVRPEQIDETIAAGGEFGVAPGLNETVVAHAKKCGIPFIPGVLTPTEIERAYSLNVTLLKFFPAEAVGGIRAIEALTGPYMPLGIRLAPTSGVNASNARDFLAQPMVAAVGGGSWLLQDELIGAKNWKGITDVVKRAVEMAQR